MEQDNAWFATFRHSPEYQLLTTRPIAYFCAEFAFFSDLPIYAGGLGVLAGDMLHEAADQQIPMVAMGLYYRGGLLRHETSAGVVTENMSIRPLTAFGFTPVVNTKNEPIIVEVPIHDHSVFARAWCLQRGVVKMFLLDTNLEQNQETDRKITDYLYIADKEIRFKQEMVLGIGGLRLLEAVGVHPIVYHLNEGHSALLALEIARHEMQEHGRSFSEELDDAKAHIVFSNHTLIPAGNDIFSNDLVATLLALYAQELQVPVDQLVKLGLIQDSSMFSMTILALRMAGGVNAVSTLHAKKAAQIWKDHPMAAVTNGIHLATWDRIGTSDLWKKHQENKRALLDNIAHVSGQKWSEDALLLGWARRIVAYKRPLSLFEDIERFVTIAENSDRPVRVVLAGRSHEKDEDGVMLFEKIQTLVSGRLKGVIAYIPHYDVDVARSLVAGCDVWLNTPIVGYEACGTSGMKAALNGVLPMSTKDGWVEEVDLLSIGWPIDNDAITKSLLDVLEHDVVPLYYAKNNEGVPLSWLTNMKNARMMIQNAFSATTMLRNYIEKMYLSRISLHLTRG